MSNFIDPLYVPWIANIILFFIIILLISGRTLSSWLLYMASIPILLNTIQSFNKQTVLNNDCILSPVTGRVVNIKDNRVTIKPEIVRAICRGDAPLGKCVRVPIYFKRSAFIPYVSPVVVNVGNPGIIYVKVGDYVIANTTHLGSHREVREKSYRS